MVLWEVWDSSFLKMCLFIFIMHVYSMCTCECVCLRSPENDVGTLELKLETAVSLSIGMKLGSSVNAAHALNQLSHLSVPGSGFFRTCSRNGSLGGADLEDCMHSVVQALCFLIRCDARGCHRSHSRGYRWRYSSRDAFPAKMVCIPWILRQTKPVLLMAASANYLVMAMRQVTNSVPNLKF